MSTTAAPAAARASPCATAVRCAANCPPSEKESGVTLRMPITDHDDPARVIKASRRAVSAWFTGVPLVLRVTPTTGRIDAWSSRASSLAGRGTRSYRRTLQSPRRRPCVLRLVPVSRLSMRISENLPPLVQEHLQAVVERYRSQTCQRARLLHAAATIARPSSSAWIRPGIGAAKPVSTRFSGPPGP